jgi:two-component system, cell cycle response regulator
MRYLRGMVRKDDEEDEEQTASVDYSTRAMAGGRRDRAHLIVLSGHRMGEMVQVTDGLTIGRGTNAGFRIDDEGISRLHIRLSVDDEGSVEVADLGSRNGMQVNEERIQSAVLQDGDKILIGTTTILKFSYADELDEVYQQQMYDSALRDPLTGLYNRRYLLDQMNAEFSYAARHRTPLSLLMMDIDHFKSINDTYGHPTGDTVLVALARLLNDAVRTEDLTARYGGEEFVLVCRNLPVLIAETVAARIRQSIEDTQLVPEQPGLKVTVSIGVASVPHPQITDALALIRAADRALYTAKRSGRNRVCVYDRPEDQTR